jgi:hypothetical protein
MIFPDQKQLSVGVFVRMAALGLPERITGSIFRIPIYDFIEARNIFQLSMTTANQKFLKPSHGPLKQTFS